MTDQVENTETGKEILLSDLTREETLTFIEHFPAKYFKQFFEELSLGASEIVEEFEWGESRDINGFTLTIVSEEGGYEGGGEHAERIFALVEKTDEKKHLAYCQMDGFYYSHHGTDWEEMPYVVYPRQVTVTQYFKTKE